MTNWFIADCCKTCERFDVKKNRKRNEIRCAFDCKKPKEFGKEYAKHIMEITATYEQTNNDTSGTVPEEGN